MSLLLDALRRAEEARRAQEAGNSAVRGDVNAPAEKIPRTQVPSAVPLEELSLEEPVRVSPAKPPAIETIEPTYAESETFLPTGLALEEVADLAAEPYSIKASAPEPALQRNAPETVALKEIVQRDMARNVFAAKQAGAQSVDNTGKRKWILPVVAAILVLLGGAGWYVWQEVARVSSPMQARAPVQPAPLSRAAPGTGQIVVVQPPAATTSTLKLDEVPIPALLPPPAIEPPMSKIPVPSASVRVLTERETLAKKLKDAPAAKDAVVGLRLAQTIAPTKVNPELAIAYQSLASGDYAVAQQQYAKLVLAEPLNVDAQLGLATAAARSGNKASAIQHYRRVLALDPRNGLAIMGLVALNEGAQPASLEIELKTLIGRNPDAAPLHFALGNLYASGQRWTEAQQAYFDAFRIDATNPDYLFNLAVSLDQLRQTRLALDYYRKAEAITKAGGGGQFDRNTIARRIKELGGEAAVGK